jgi:hypothetical protein
MKKILLIFLLLIVSACSRVSVSNNINKTNLETGNSSDNFQESGLVIKNIREVHYFSDGGTTGFVAENMNGEELKFCYDGRMIPDYEVTLPRHIYINAIHPERDGAQKLGLGSHEEEIILKSLKDWVSINYSPEEITKFTKVNTVVGLSDKELKLYRSLSILNKYSEVIIE